MKQPQLAEAAGMTQGAIAKIANNNPNGSSKLHLIARALRTTPAYLTGEIDDPDQGAPLPPPAHSNLLDSINDLHPRDRAALLRIARSLTDRPQATIALAMPSTAALTVALQTYLDHTPGLGWDELAHDLATQLPMILQAAGDGVVSPHMAAPDSDDAPPAIADDEPRPARRERRS